MRDEDYTTQTLSETTATPGAPNFQSSRSTERKSDPLIRIAALRDRGSTDTRTLRGRKKTRVKLWESGNGKMCGWYVCIPRRVWAGGFALGWGGWQNDDGGRTEPKAVFFFFLLEGGKGWLINGFKPPGHTWVELPVLCSRVVSNWKFSVLFLKKKNKQTRKTLTKQKWGQT